MRILLVSKGLYSQISHVTNSICTLSEKKEKNTAQRLTTTLVKSSRMNFHKVVCILSMMLNYKYLAHAHVH